MIIGDLSFIHDSNALHLIEKYKIPITILLINNSGGGIFHRLPISEIEDKKLFDEYFIIPHKTKFEGLCLAYNIPYHQVSDKNSLSQIMTSFEDENHVIEIITDSHYSESINDKIKMDFILRLKMEKPE